MQTKSHFEYRVNVARNKDILKIFCIDITFLLKNVN